MTTYKIKLEPNICRTGGAIAGNRRTFIEWYRKIVKAAKKQGLIIVEYTEDETHATMKLGPKGGDNGRAKKKKRTA